MRWALLATPWWLLGTWRPLATAGDRWYPTRTRGGWVLSVLAGGDHWVPLGTWVPGDPGYLATNWVLAGYFYWVPGDPGLKDMRGLVRKA